MKTCVTEISPLFHSYTSCFVPFVLLLFCSLSTLGASGSVLSQTSVCVACVYDCVCDDSSLFVSSYVLS